MEARVPGFPGVLWILLLFACFSTRIEAAFDSESFLQKLDAMQKILDYIKNRPEQMNLDAIFGVTLAEANLVAAFLHGNVQYLGIKSIHALKDMIILSTMIRKNLTSTLPKDNLKSLTLSALNNPNLWTKSISWTKLFSRSRPNPSQLSYSEVVRSMWHGTPTETESDQCLIKIVYSYSIGECMIPATCVDILLKEDGSTGYPLTHRLLIVQVAKALECEKAASFSSLVRTYCARIFQDLVNFEEWNFSNVSRDLVLEQIVLCGMEGYYEFVDKRYEDIILSWLNWYGCFDASRFANEHKVNRRSSSTIDFGCNNHTTGLAVASLAVFIRENIENLSQP